MSLTPYCGGRLTNVDPYNELTMWDPFAMYPTTISKNNQLSKLRNEAVQPLTQLMSADLIESENDYHIHVDIPGVENLDINTDNQILTIDADRKVLHETETGYIHTRERAYGKVRRRLRIPFDADADRATAKYKDGVLTVSIPKSGERSQKKKINVTSHEEEKKET